MRLRPRGHPLNVTATKSTRAAKRVRMIDDLITSRDAIQFLIPSRIHHAITRNHKIVRARGEKTRQQISGIDLPVPIHFVLLRLRTPCRTTVTVSNPRCGCRGKPGTSWSKAETQHYWWQNMQTHNSLASLARTPICKAFIESAAIKQIRERAEQSQMPELPERPVKSRS